MPLKSKEERVNDLEEIELLMEKLSTAKGRKEKRRLLAIYNSKQA